MRTHRRRRRSRARIALAPRLRTCLREAAGCRHRRRHVGRGAERRRLRSRRSRGREHELARRVREDDRLRLAHGGTERRQRHERSRPDASSCAGSRPASPTTTASSASNGSGSTRGADATFTTQGQPEVATGSASLLGPTAATVGGTVDPNGRTTGWWIEYGTSTRYGSRTDTRSAGAGTCAGRRLRSPREASGRDRVPLQARRVERPRHRARRRPGVSHRSGAGGGDGWRRRRRRLVRTRQRDRRPARTRNGRVVRVRHEHEAREPDAGSVGREPGEDLCAHRRPAARHAVLLPRRRPE